MNKNKDVVILPGDGIGPEVTQEAINVLEAVTKHQDVNLNIRKFHIGGSSIDRFDTPLTEEAVEACRQSDAVFLGAVGGAKWDDLPKEKRPEAGLLQLRSKLDLFINMRPVKVYESLLKSSPLKKELIEDTDILIVRELTGGIYFGRPRFTKKEGDHTVAVDTMRYNSQEITRIAEKAFEFSRKRSRILHSVDKANVLDSSRLWRKQVKTVAQKFGDVQTQHMLVDNCAMQLLRHPKQFDVILTSNLFGDILSDEAAMITGSIGMLPSASLGENSAVYEPVHGSAPDIAGENKANPLAAIASIALMCRYSLDMNDAADDIDSAIMEVLKKGYRSPDNYSGSSNEFVVDTSEIGEAVINNLSSQKQAI